MMGSGQTGPCVTASGGGVAMSSGVSSSGTASNAQTGGGGATGSSLFINKLKIVGSGQNWAVTTCEPFYLMSVEPPAGDAPLTGSRNLIEHYGLESAYRKFCGKKLREELSAFLPHLSGNVDVPATEDGSGLQALIERPPICGKDILPFPQSQLDPGFRLHPGPLPQDYANLFAASDRSTILATIGSRKEPKKRRRDVHRGAGGMAELAEGSAGGSGGGWGGNPGGSEGSSVAVQPGVSGGTCPLPPASLQPGNSAGLGAVAMQPLSAVPGLSGASSGALGTKTKKVRRSEEEERKRKKKKDKKKKKEKSD